MRIILGLIGCVLSVAIIVYRVPVKHFIGNIDWAEQKLGSGGTYTVVLFFAFIIFMSSLMYMTNSFDLIFGEIGSKLFGSA